MGKETPTFLGSCRLFFNLSQSLHQLLLLTLYPLLLFLCMLALFLFILKLGPGGKHMQTYGQILVSTSAPHLAAGGNTAL